uniref:DUF4244 domain-containing protein n=1 Tax=Kroppenstedtia sanguinis TaxID=1380684 RepID=UPI003D2627FC
MDLLRWLFRGIRSKRGSPTVEYVFVMVAATMLAGIVVGIVKSEPVQASLRQVIFPSFMMKTENLPVRPGNTWPKKTLSPKSPILPKMSSALFHYIRSPNPRLQ